MAKHILTFADLCQKAGGAFFQMKASDDPTKVVMCFVGHKIIYRAEVTGEIFAGVFDKDFDQFTLRIHAVQIPQDEQVWEVVGFRWPFEAAECLLPNGTIVGLRLPWHVRHES